MKIATGSDHAGFKLKETVRKHLLEKGIEVKDFGTYTEDSVDYPDFAHPVANAVENKEVDFGIIMCGSGNGINMAANKHKGIRAALSWNAEIAKLSRQHNDANILTLPGRFIEEAEALKAVDVFLETAFEGGRHQKRVEKI
jgi:ribose 5-phosphate isomerase B